MEIEISFFTLFMYISYLIVEHDEELWDSSMTCPFATSMQAVMQQKAGNVEWQIRTGQQWTVECGSRIGE